MGFGKWKDFARGWVCYQQSYSDYFDKLKLIGIVANLFPKLELKLESSMIRKLIRAAESGISISRSNYNPTIESF